MRLLVPCGNLGNLLRCSGLEMKGSELVDTPAEHPFLLVLPHVAFRDRPLRSGLYRTPAGRPLTLTSNERVCAPRRNTCQTFDPERASPASLSSCVSPGSFYASASESPSSPPPPPPPPPLPDSGGPTSDDFGGAAARDGKENQAPPPLSPPEDGEGEPSEEASDVLASSKFFGGSGGGEGGKSEGGVGVKGMLVRQSGLRRRFRPPLAAPRHAASTGASRGGSAVRRGHGSGVGGADRDYDDDSGKPYPWGAECAHPRLDASRLATAASSGERRPNGVGRSGSGTVVPSSRGVGRGLKRRRTLGVGSLVPSGLIRGLEGVVGGGLGGPGRRSKSLGGGHSVVKLLRHSSLSVMRGAPLVCDACVA